VHKKWKDLNYELLLEKFDIGGKLSAYTRYNGS